jgi:PAS domain-containing protein
MMNLTREESRAAADRTFRCGPWDEHKALITGRRDVYPVAVLNERGLILDCNESFEALFGFEWSGLIWHHVSLLFPHLTADDFVQAGEAHPMRDYLIRCGQQHQAQNRHGLRFPCNLIFVRILHEGMCCLRMTVVTSGEGAS